MDIQGDRRARRYLAAAGCFALLAAVLLFVQLLGLTSRSYAERFERHRVTGPREAYALLERLGVRGRVLVLFDSTSHISDRTATEYARALDSRPASLPLSPTDFVSGFLVAGTVREVWVPVPSSHWSEVSSWATRGDFIAGPDRRAGRFFGAPVVYVKQDALPSFREKVITYVAEGSRGDYSPELLASFEDDSRSDVVIVQDGR